jgi:hypothetical protein
MKKALVASAAVLIVGYLFAAPISFEDAKRARGGVPIYDVVTLSKYLDQHMGEQICVVCRFRGKDIHQLKPNWYESSISQPDPQKKGQSANVRVVIAKKDLDAFKSIPTAVSGDAIILCGHVEHDDQAHFSFLRLVSRNVPGGTSAHP